VQQSIAFLDASTAARMCRSDALSTPRGAYQAWRTLCKEHPHRRLLVTDLADGHHPNQSRSRQG